MPQTIKPEDVIETLLDMRGESILNLCWCSRGWMRPESDWPRYEGHRGGHSARCRQAQALMAQTLEAL